MPLTDKERESLRNPYHDQVVAVFRGELLEISHLPHRKKKPLYHRRGQIKGFTKGARLRMLRMIASINWGSVKHGVFITLTYPDEHADRSMGERNTDKYLFMRYIEKHLGKKVGVIWRLEWEPRKSGKRLGQLTAHWHLIVFGIKFIPKDVVRSFWQCVLRADGPVVTWIDGITTGKKLARYVGKYCSKLPEADVLDNSTYLNSQGRHWGVMRRELVPFADRVVIPCLTDKELHLVENLACMTFRYFCREAQQGFSVFGENAKKVGEILFEKRIDAEGNYWYPDLHQVGSRASVPETPNVSR